jgi:hypothetical protein
MLDEQVQRVEMQIMTTLDCLAIRSQALLLCDMKHLLTLVACGFIFNRNYSARAVKAAKVTERSDSCNIV